MADTFLSPDGVVDNDRHHHHDRHTAELAGDGVHGDAHPTPEDDPVAVIEAALVRLVDDVGVIAEDEVIRAFSDRKSVV